jgi:hypothetical protein
MVSKYINMVQKHMNNRLVLIGVYSVVLKCITGENKSGRALTYPSGNYTLLETIYISCNIPGKHSEA